MIDEIIEGAVLYDGVDARPFTTDLAIVADRIALIGDLREREAYRRIDGRGRTLAPGFVEAVRELRGVAERSRAVVRATGRDPEVAARDLGRSR
ncbi:MAG: hypothetical protein NVS4B5_09280 [Vulcanimicrobiaceae bacterium]